MLRLGALSLFATALLAAEFQTGEAARLVLGQSSFSREGSLRASSLSFASNRLYATEILATQRYRLLVFDTTRFPTPKGEIANQGTACAVCGFRPIYETELQVPPDSPQSVDRGGVSIVADTAAHRVLIWRDGKDHNQSPSLILGESPGAGIIEPISVAYDGVRFFVGDAARHRVLVWNALPSADNQAPDAVLGSSLTSSGDVLGPDSIRRPVALVSDGTNLFVADSGASRILVFTAADSALPGNAVVNAASLLPDAFAPGTLVDISGKELSTGIESAPDDSDEPLPRKLGGTEVLLNGVPLPILSVSPAQVRVQVPYEVLDSAASLYVRTERSDGSVMTTNATVLKVAPVSPGLFAFAGREPRTGMLLHSAASPITAENPAAPGEVVVVWATGLGALNASPAPEAGRPYASPLAGDLLNPVSAIVNGQPAQVLSAGLLPGAIGIYEIRILLPDTLRADPNAHFAVTQNDSVSNTVTFPIGSGSR